MVYLSSLCYLTEEMKLGQLIKNAWLCICEAIQKAFSARRPAREMEEEHQTTASEGSAKEKSEPHGLREEIPSSANSDTHDDSSAESDVPKTTVATPDNHEPAPIASDAPEVGTTSVGTGDTESGEVEEKRDNHELEEESPSSAGPNTDESLPVQSGAPRKIGGRRGNKPPKNIAKKQKAEQRLYCDLICVEGRNKQWSIAVSVPKDHHVLSVRQNGMELSTSGNDHHYVLEDICHDVVVEFEEGKKKSIILSGEKHFRVFKTRQNWEGIGRRVKTVSSGYYVVFADETCGSRTGNAPICPEPCRYPGFVTHFFQITDETSADGFENCPFYSPKRRFSLKGKCIHNDVDGEGIFIGNAPRLNDTEDWKGVSWVIVGKEDTGDVLKEFKVGQKDAADVLNNYLNNRQNGWFFVRIYDDETFLLHSMDFRWVKDLQAIHVNDNPNWQDSLIVPSESRGHSETKVEFQGDVLVRSVGSPHIHETASNVFVVPPRPNSDRVKWVFKSNEEETESEMALPRIWFKFTDGEQKNADWRDKPVKMKREEFIKAKNKNAHIRVPLFVKEARIGFNNLDQVFPSKLCEDRKTRSIDFQLGNFADYSEFEKHLHERITLRAQLDINGIIVPIIYILADEPLGDGNPISPPIAYVMQGAGAFRPGKGFSREELQEANLSNDTAIDWRIKRDKRRRTAHRQNIEALIMYNKEYDAQQK